MTSAAGTPAPAVGQVWADNDKRSYGRLLRIVEIDATHATVALVSPRDRGVSSAEAGRRTRIRLDRLKPTSTGYRLITDTPGGAR